jgi:hypothetical protein
MPLRSSTPRLRTQLSCCKRDKSINPKNLGREDIVKKVCAIVAALALLAGPAATAADWAPLSPGKSAGVNKAQDEDNNIALYIIGGGALIAGIVVLGADNNNTAAPAPATTTTATTSS